MNQKIKNFKADKDYLQDQVILITGAGDGIGRAVAVGLAAHGATIILLGKTIAKLNQTYDLISKNKSPEAAIYALNLEGATADDYLEMAEKIKQEFGRLDGIIHNAASLQQLSPIELYDSECWFKVMQVNVNAPFLLTQACLPLLRQSKAASILFTSDSVGRKGKAYWGAYGVSKFAIEGLMQTLADELENTAIRVNSLNPNPTNTALRRQAYPAENPNQNPQAEEHIPYYLWLMGKDGRKIHGEML